MTPFDEYALGRGISILELRDANAECRLHGRCAFDPDPPCGCFPIEEPSRRSKRLGVPRPTYSVFVRRRAVGLYASGMSSRLVAELTGASQRTVLAWVRAAGVEVRGRGRPWPGRKAA